MAGDWTRDALGLGAFLTVVSAFQKPRTASHDLVNLMLHLPMKLGAGEISFEFLCSSDGCRDCLLPQFVEEAHLRMKVNPSMLRTCNLPYRSGAG